MDTQKWYVIWVPSFTVAAEEELGPREEGACPADGDPHRPWFQDAPHADGEHVHLRASSSEEACARAKAIHALLKGEEVGDDELIEQVA